MALLFVLPGPAANAATINWTNTSGGNWTNAANWSPNQVPGAGDNAFIANNGTYVVTRDGDISVASLTVGGTSGTQSLTWTTGTLGGSARVTIAANGALNLSGAADKTIRGVLTNAGTVMWTGTGNFVLTGASGLGQVQNLPGGLFDAQNNQTISSDGYGSEFFNNAGTFRKSGGAGTTTVGVGGVGSGTWSAANGTEIRFQAGYSFEGTNSFLGLGAVRLAAGITLNGGVVTENLTLAPGCVITGTNTVSGLLTWEAGRLSSPMQMTIASDGTLKLANTPDKELELFGAVLNNDGVVNWNGGTISTRNGAVINNRSRWNVRTGDPISWDGVGSQPSFNNTDTGLLREPPKTVFRS